MLTFELFEHGSKSKLKSEILLYYKVKKDTTCFKSTTWMEFSLS